MWRKEMNAQKRMILKWDKFFWNLRKTFKKYLKTKSLSKEELTTIIDNLDQEYSKLDSAKIQLWKDIKKNYTEWLSSQEDEINGKVATEEYDCIVLQLQIDFYCQLSQILATIC
jgi:phage-related tail protein